MKEEHVDGGYLVTQGVYVGTEDFNKAVVRRLMVCFAALDIISALLIDDGPLDRKASGPFLERPQ